MKKDPKQPRGGAPRRPVEERVRDYKHVYQPMPAIELRMQGARCMDCGVPFCTSGCPLGNHIPDWNDLVYRDDWRRAFDRLRLTNNFPEFTGLLCPAPCEAACVLNISDDAVTIKDIELGIVNRAFEEGWIVPRPPSRRTGKRVAIVGSGPAGLAAAQQLNWAGHEVTVFEKDDRLGGLLRYGIPDFKIEKWVVDRRIDLLRREGITFLPNHHVGEAIAASDLQAEFDAVLLAVGALQGRSLAVEGHALDGVHLAMEYLVGQNRRVAGDPVHEATAISARDKRVVVIGGGDTSADCLGNAHREGARSVQVLTHGPRPPDLPDSLAWPDWPFVLHSYPAHEEGGERHWNLAVTRFSGSADTVEQVHLAEVVRNDGIYRIIPGTERTMEADLVLLAIGFEGPVRDRLLDDLALEFTPSGAIRSDELYRTGQPEVYVAGDARRGASLIVWAIAEGRAAASQIHRALSSSAIQKAG